MKKYVFRFKIKHMGLDDEVKIVSGFGFAENYVEAVGIIERSFDNDLIAILYLELLEEDCGLIFLPEQVCENYSKTFYPIISYSTKASEENAETGETIC
jgi:hypothetical protein